MAINVKPLEQAAQKYQDNASAGSGRYASNAAAAGARYVQAAVAAKGAYKSGVSQGGIEDRYARGVQRSGAERYTGRITSVGESRYTEGVSQAGDEWQEGFGPYASTIAGLTLPGRRPRGDAGNYSRVKAIGDALHARRLALLGG